MKTNKIVTIISLLIGMSFSVALAANRKAPLKVNAYTSYGDRYFTGYNCTVESFSDKPLASGTSYGFTTEITPTNGAKNVMVRFNNTVNGAPSSSLLANPETLIEMIHTVYDSGNPDDNYRQICDAVIYTITYTKDRTQSISLINQFYNSSYTSYTVSLTDKLEMRDDGIIYVKGTNVRTFGMDNNAGNTYNTGGYKLRNKESFIYGCDYFYVGMTTSGNVYHNNYRIYANVTDSGFLSANKTALAGTEYEDLYTSSYVSTLLTNLSSSSSSMGFCSLSIKFLGIKTENLGGNKLSFRTRQIDSRWIGDNVNSTPVTTYPYSLPKYDSNLEEIKLYTDINYKLVDIIDSFNTYRTSDGVNPVDKTGWNDITTHNDYTWFNNSTFQTKTISLTSPGTKGISIYTRCNTSPAAWSDRYLYQDIPFYFTLNPTTEATTFSSTFISTTTTICETGGTGADHSAALIAVWNVKSTPDGNSLVEKWEALSSEAKTIFNEGTANATITNAHNRYVYIMGRYGNVLTAFDEGPVVPNVAMFNTSGLFALDNDTTIIILMVVATSVSLIAYTLLIIKKKDY